jgi:hypothetical protein
MDISVPLPSPFDEHRAHYTHGERILQDLPAEPKSPAPAKQDFLPHSSPSDILFVFLSPICYSYMNVPTAGG